MNTTCSSFIHTIHTARHSSELIVVPRGIHCVVIYHKSCLFMTLHFITFRNSQTLNLRDSFHTNTYFDILSNFHCVAQLFSPTLLDIFRFMDSTALL